MDRIQRSHERSRLGRLLLEKGIISEEQLSKAIEQQKITGQKLGEVLTGWNLATQRQINGLLRRQRNLRMAAAVATKRPQPRKTAVGARPRAPSLATREKNHCALLMRQGAPRRVG